MYGPSKDFGVNGLRLGVLVSQANPDLHVAMEANALLMKISSASVRWTADEPQEPKELELTGLPLQDVLWSNLLLNPVGLPTYLALNKSRLAEAYRRATTFLQKHAIPYRPAHAGHFVWIDLRRFLPTADVEGNRLESESEQEVELVKRFLAHGINLVSGVRVPGRAPF